MSNVSINLGLSNLQRFAFFRKHLALAQPDNLSILGYSQFSK